MRHGKKNNHLGRTAQHRSALMSNMASSLILHKRIETTVAKAKALRKYVEPLITKSKEDSTHSRRVIFSYLQNKGSVKELFDTVSEKIAERPGGYTRIIKLPNRLGDNAEMCIIELVDFNMLYSNNEAKEAKSKTRRSRRSASAGTAKVAAEDAKVVTEAQAAPEEEVISTAENIADETPANQADETKQESES